MRWFRAGRNGAVRLTRHFSLCCFGVFDDHKVIPPTLLNCRIVISTIMIEYGVGLSKL